MERDESRTDEELVSAANRGDSDALAALYLRYRDWVLSLAFRFTGEREAAQDVAQEAWVYLLSKFPGFRLRARLTTVLYPAVKNTALAIRRKKKAAPAEVEVLEPFAAPAVEGAAEGRALVEAVSRLPEGQREVLIMRAVDEMSLAEVAMALGIPEGTVKSRLHHAIAALKGQEGLKGLMD